MKRTLTLIVVCAAASLALAACGSSSKSTTPTAAGGGGGATGAGGGGGGAVVDLKADPSQLKYDKTALSAKAGSVTIHLTNPAALQHDVAVQQGSQQLGKTDLISGGKSADLSLNLKPGKYTFFCTVPGHEQAGMKGTLTVK